MQEKTNNQREKGFSLNNKKGVEILLLSLLLTLLCYGITTKYIIPDIGFFRYLGLEIMIALSIKLVDYIKKHKK